MLAVVLMVPLGYVLLSIFELQRAAYAVTTATREAGRAFVTAPTVDEAYAGADAAVRIALADQGLTGTEGRLRIDCSTPDSCLRPGTVVWVSAEITVPLPLLAAPSVSVRGRHAELVDRFRPERE
jgi:hypothetical protein